MYSLLFLATLPSQFVDHPQFSKAQQQAAFEATVRTYHEASRSVGTAVIVGRKGESTYLLTAAHLVPVQSAPGRENVNIKSVELFLYSAKQPDKVSHGEARVVARMPNEDLALLEAKLANPPAVVPICPKDKLVMPLPMTVMTLGAIPDGPPDIAIDRVRAKSLVRKPDRSEALYWEADIPQRSGRSGGPMIDARGYLIGIASGTQHEKGYYTCVDEFFRPLRDEGYAWLYGPPPAKK